MERRLRTRFAWSVGLATIGITLRVVWRMRTDGADGFPEPPFVMAANHHSFLDPLLVGAAFGGRARFIGLVDLLGNYRFVDWVIDAFEVITIRRGTVPLGAMRQSLDHLKSGGVVGLFPEGTRRESFGEGRLYPGAAWLATRAGVPLVAVAVLGSDRVLGIDNKPHRGQVEVVVGPTLHPVGTGRDAVNDLTDRWREWMTSAVGNG